MSDYVSWPEDFAAQYRALGYWTGETLGGMLRTSAERWPSQVALMCGSRAWTYAVLDEHVDRLAAGLLRLGLLPGDRVVVQLPNVGEFFVLCFALFRLGVLPVFAQPAHRRSEIEHFCRLTDAVAYVLADEVDGFDYRVLAEDVQGLCPALKHLVVLGQALGAVSFEGLYSEPSERQHLMGPKGGDWAFLQLSGGSTGLPKLIPRTHDDYLYSVRASAQICGLSTRSVYLCALPVAHNFPLSSPGSLGVLCAGGTVVLTPSAVPDVAFPLVMKHGVNITALVPPLLKVWLDAVSHRPEDLSSLSVVQVGGARLSDAVAVRVRDVLGCQLQQVFGMAEGLVSYTRLDDSMDLVCSTQGLPMSPHDEIRVVDDDDVDVPVGSVGHLLTRGPYTIRGYYRAPEHNIRVFTVDGFYRTGDLVRVLPSGHLVVEGRSKDQINRGGEKIAAEEVENHLLAHPAVRDVALVSMPDAYLGERSCAFVIARGQRPRALELTRFLRERGLAVFKIPDRVEFTDQFPKTPIGKVDKRALREQASLF